MARCGSTARPGRLDVLASASERTELLEVLQIRTGRGPCVECYRTGAAQTIPRIAAQTERWPRISAAGPGSGLPVGARGGDAGAATGPSGR